MSSHSHTIVNENNGSVVTKHHREAHTDSVTGHYVSSLVVNLRQLHTDLHAQHQHDKEALNKLNRTFQAFVDRVHQLQLQNDKYRAAISEYRRHASGYSGADLQLDENFLVLKRDASAIGQVIVDCEWDYELSQLQMGIYKQLIDIEYQGETKRIGKLEDDVKKSASLLLELRSSYGEMQRRVESLYVECDDLFKQYLTLTHDWSIVKKQRHKGHLSMEALKSSIAFYKNIQSYAGR